MRPYRPERLPVFHPLCQAAKQDWRRFAAVAQEARSHFGQTLHAAPTAAAYLQQAGWILKRLEMTP